MHTKNDPGALAGPVFTDDLPQPSPTVVAAPGPLTVDPDSATSAQLRALLIRQHQGATPAAAQAIAGAVQAGTLSVPAATVPGVPQAWPVAPLATPGRRHALCAAASAAVDRAAAARRSQFQRYLARTVASPLAHHALPPDQPSGPALARLIDHDVRVVQRFDDHAWVAARLLACGAIESLIRVAASGLLKGVARHVYRMAIDAWMDRG